MAAFIKYSSKKWLLILEGIIQVVSKTPWTLQSNRPDFATTSPWRGIIKLLGAKTINKKSSVWVSASICFALREILLKVVENCKLEILPEVIFLLSKAPECVGWLLGVCFASLCVVSCLVVCWPDTGSWCATPGDNAAAFDALFSPLPLLPTSFCLLHLHLRLHFMASPLSFSMFLWKTDVLPVFPPPFLSEWVDKIWKERTWLFWSLSIRVLELLKHRNEDCCCAPLATIPAADVGHSLCELGDWSRTENATAEIEAPEMGMGPTSQIPCSTSECLTGFQPQFQFQLAVSADPGSSRLGLRLRHWFLPSKWEAWLSVWRCSGGPPLSVIWGWQPVLSPGSCTLLPQFLRWDCSVLPKMTSVLVWLILFTHSLQLLIFYKS